MLYTSERNYGCRFLEVSLFGLRTIILENEKIRIMILVDKGTDIVEFTHKQTDTDVIWRSPLGLSCLKQSQLARKDEQVLTDGYYGGWFEAFPNVGTACTYRGASIPYYGEVCYLPWEYTVQKDEPDEVSLRCFLKTVKTPFIIEKIFTVKSGIGTLFIEESVKNIGLEIIEYQWGHHPNLGSNFIDENCTMDMPNGEISVHYSNENSRFECGQLGTWPYISDKNGKKVDLRIIYPKGIIVNEVLDVNELSKGYVSVINHKKSLKFELQWDGGSMFNHNAVWQVSGNDQGYPRYGRTKVLGFIPRSDSIWGISDSATKGMCEVIEPGQLKKLWLTASINEV